MIPALPRRIAALAWKEWLQLCRDRATLGMLIGVPLLQIVLFGCAIELSPHAVPMLLIPPANASGGPEAMIMRRLAREPAFAQLRIEPSPEAAHRALADGRAVLVIDARHRPVSVDVDATDPVLASQAANAIERFARSLGNADLAEGADDGVPHVRMLYNPGANSQAYLVPGLLGVILTMTMVMMSALTVARERERGTYEGLRHLGTRPVEMWAGKLLPYLAFGLVQAALILLVARWGFGIHVLGSLWFILVATMAFACANLVLGFLFSILASQQMQAMQMSFFFFLPSSLLSGFMFPFVAMPAWARAIGEILPLTHYLRIVRGVTLKDVSPGFIGGELLPIIAFAAAASVAALLAARRGLRE
jgi:ABC-2 type transport system permease protein